MSILIILPLATVASIINTAMNDLTALRRCRYCLHEEEEAG